MLSNAQQIRPHRTRPSRICWSIARDLTSSLAAEDRYARLLWAVRRAIPCDAACLLRLEGDALVPVAGHGLSGEALAMRYPVAEHPRLATILEASEPVRFPEDSPLPDPFDGLLEDDPGGELHIHACLGCQLTEGGEVVGCADGGRPGPAGLRRPRPAPGGDPGGAGRGGARRPPR